MEKQPIGIFDSGLGGISVLAEAIRLMPNENFLYYGDTLHAPYGDKAPEEVFKHVITSINYLLNHNCKAVVLACNTATSVAAQSLRAQHDLPIIGMEPALKPASLLNCEGKILVMATKLTLAQTKFSNLMDKYGENAIPIPCSGLMELVEQGKLQCEETKQLISHFLSPYLTQKIKAVVLGCTHYVFLRESIQKIVGSTVPILDGNKGTVRELERRLILAELREKDEETGTVTFMSSCNDPQIIIQMNAMLNCCS